MTNVDVIAVVNRTHAHRAEKLEIAAASITSRLMQIADKTQAVAKAGKTGRRQDASAPRT